MARARRSTIPVARRPLLLVLLLNKIIFITSRHNFVSGAPPFTNFKPSRLPPFLKTKTSQRRTTATTERLRNNSIFFLLRGGGSATALTKSDKIAILSGRTPQTHLTLPPKTSTAASRRLRRQRDVVVTDAPRHPITLACVPAATWSQFTGREFQDNPAAIHQLTETALSLCRVGDDASSSSDLTWTAANSQTKDVMAATCGKDDVDEGVRDALVNECPKDAVLLWTAKFSKTTGGGGGGGDCYGGQLPLVRSRGLVRGMSPRDIAALLMDSSRVTTYNKMSLGRTDVTILQEGIDTVAGNTAYGDGETKIVRNLTKPPLVKSLMEFRTMMHARKLRPEKDGAGEGYIVVSRAVVGDGDGGDETENVKRSEILIGVNLLRRVETGGDVMTDLTSVTHVNSPFVHPLVAGKVGIKGAVDFFNDIRGVAE